MAFRLLVDDDGVVDVSVAVGTFRNFGCEAPEVTGTFLIPNTFESCSVRWVGAQQMATMVGLGLGPMEMARLLPVHNCIRTTAKILKTRWRCGGE
jgi:hypothetical protein